MRLWTIFRAKQAVSLLLVNYWCDLEKCVFLKKTPFLWTVRELWEWFECSDRRQPSNREVFAPSLGKPRGFETVPTSYFTKFNKEKYGEGALRAESSLDSRTNRSFRNIETAKVFVWQRKNGVGLNLYWLDETILENNDIVTQRNVTLHLILKFSDILSVLIISLVTIQC